MLLRQVQPEYMAKAFLMKSGTRSNQDHGPLFGGTYSDKTQQEIQEQVGQDAAAGQSWASFNLQDDKNLLPESYKPCPNTVIVGRGREPKENEGNKRLRILAEQYLAEYSTASDKRTKTRIVNAIVSSIKQSGGTFVKYVKKNRRDGRQWRLVKDTTSREKVGYVFRDLLSDKYRSSSKSKVAARRQQISTSSNITNSPSVSDPLALDEVINTSSTSSEEKTVDTTGTSNTEAPAGNNKNTNDEHGEGTDEDIMEPKGIEAQPLPLFLANGEDYANSSSSSSSSTRARSNSSCLWGLSATSATSTQTLPFEASANDDCGGNIMGDAFPFFAYNNNSKVCDNNYRNDYNNDDFLPNHEHHRQIGVSSFHAAATIPTSLFSAEDEEDVEEVGCNSNEVASNSWNGTYYDAAAIMTSSWGQSQVPRQPSGSTGVFSAPDPTVAASLVESLLTTTNSHTSSNNNAEASILGSGNLRHYYDNHGIPAASAQQGNNNKNLLSQLDMDELLSYPLFQ